MTNNKTVLILGWMCLVGSLFTNFGALFICSSIFFSANFIIEEIEKLKNKYRRNMEEFKEKVQRVLEGKVVNFTTTELVSPDKAEKILLELGFEDEDNFECSGWDWYFWKKYSKDGITYTLAGSGWYNNGLTFSKN